MRILCLDIPAPGASLEKYAPHLNAEALHAWGLYKSGFIRDIYFRQDRPGVAIFLECDSVDEAMNVMAEFPLANVGVSNHNLAQIRRANEILNASGYSLSAVQNHYSLLYRASEEAGILDYCRQNNITFFAYMVLEQGALSGRYDSNHPMPAGSGRAESYNAVLPQIERLTAAMKKMGAERNASVAQIAIAWAIAKGTLPLVGATKVHHVLDAACASDIQLRDEEIILLEQLAAETRVDTRGAWEKPMV